ncbi:leukocyte immunoglobulin-like receptor subfamily B member 3 [Macrotis lagotis]|uniref:leukocyte immunoglobulin-like receptor subfamily B member 3 n=1 Tax=Macrotis lagotis TaxID=92651 RepID=UPI003D683741
MAPTLSAQLCLGLCLCWGIWAQEGPLPRPSLRAEPGLVIPWGKQVILWCVGTLGSELYRLRNERNYVDMEKSADGREAKAFISYMERETAGKYKCSYKKQSWSEASEDLELRVTGSYDPPSLSAFPSSQVTSGHNVTFQCQSLSTYGRFALYKAGEQIIHWQTQNTGRGAHANFSILSVTPADGGTYRCYSFHSNNPYVWSAPSNPLVLRVTGQMPRPTLRAEPGSVITWEKPVTLWCEGPPGADLYLLRKEGEDLNMEMSGDGRRAQVLISHMTAINTGRYQCLYMNQSLWSEASDPLELRVTGAYDPPSLSALPSSQVPSGQEVTLRCQSQLGYGTSALLKDGEEIIRWGDQNNELENETNFSIPAVSPAHGGTYQCYSFISNYPYVWSAPSDPLVLRVIATPGLSSLQVGILVGTSTFLILLFLLLLFLFCRCWRHRTRLRKGDRDTEAKRTTRSSDPAGTPLEETLYADVGEDRHTEEARPEDAAAPVGEDPQEVTYALLNLNSLKGRAEDPSHSGAGDPSLYAALK